MFKNLHAIIGNCQTVFTQSIAKKIDKVFGQQHYVFTTFSERWQCNLENGQTEEKVFAETSFLYLFFKIPVCCRNIVRHFCRLLFTNLSRSPLTQVLAMSFACRVIAISLFSSRKFPLLASSNNPFCLSSTVNELPYGEEFAFKRSLTEC